MKQCWWVLEKERLRSFEGKQTSPAPLPAAHPALRGCPPPQLLLEGQAMMSSELLGAQAHSTPRNPESRQSKLPVYFRSLTPQAWLLDTESIRELLRGNCVSLCAGAPGGQQVKEKEARTTHMVMPLGAIRVLVGC